MLDFVIILNNQILKYNNLKASCKYFFFFFLAKYVHSGTNGKQDHNDKHKCRTCKKL